MSRTLSVAAGGELVLANVSGDIHVEGVDGRQLEIRVTKRLRRGSPGDLDRVAVEIEERGDRVEVRTVYPRRASGNISVEYEVRMPRDARVSIRSISGDVALSGVAGESRVDTVSGDLVISAAPHLARVKTVSGDIQLRDAGTDGELSAESVSGDIDASGLRVARLDLSTVSGEVTLSAVQSGQAAIRTVSGSVDYIGSLARDGRYEMQSHSGDVRLALDDGVGFELEAGTFSGRIRTGFTMTADGFDSGRGRGRTMTGRHGDGSARLDLTSFSGDIIVEPR